ncbi:MAG: DUF86 domain-containing protein [Phyllobacteriaceae bacterium]|nr:DUF86 domain-containing protein [Phyllobacteriaceae bacterium]
MTDAEKDLRAHLESLLALCDKAAVVAGRCNRDSFANDEIVQLAIFALIGQFGEMSRRMLERFPDFSEDHPELPFAKAKGMRNRIVHEYEGVDLDIVWATFNIAIPQFGAALRPIVKAFDEYHGISKP